MSDIGSKHTPGPWSVMTNDAWRKAGGLQPSSVCHIGDLTIVTDYMTYDFHGTDEDDARLIAAAPDMLAALEEIVFHADPQSPTMACARNAIAKATGASCTPPPAAC